MQIKDKKTTLLQLEKVNTKMTKAFNVFQETLNEVEQVQDELKVAVEESEVKILTLQVALAAEQNARQKALDAIKTNEELKEKLKQFTI